MKEEIQKRIEYIKNKFKKLEMSLNKYEQEIDEDYKYIELKAIERDSEEIIECSIRINQEILNKIDVVAETYKKSFLELKKLNIFETFFLEKISNTTIFRNKLAHEYMGLDTISIIRNAKQILNLYPKYLIKIIEYIEKK